MRVIQLEQEAIVSRIWALGTEAGHRSHEGANAHSALVDWSWSHPPHLPTTTFLSLLFFSLSLLTHRSQFYGFIFVTCVFSFDQSSLAGVYRKKKTQLFYCRGGGNGSIIICMVARIVQQVSNESLPQTSTFHKSTLPLTMLS